MLSIFAERSIVDAWQDSEYASEWHIETWEIEHLSILGKLGVFIALPIIQNQSKTKTIPHAVFETSINNNSQYKTQKVSWWSFKPKMLEIFTRAFLLKLIIGTKIKFVFSGSFKYCKVFSLKMKKESSKRWDNNKVFSYQKIQ